MHKYILRRLIESIPVMLAVTIVVFMLMRFIPGDVVDAMAADRGQVYGMDLAKIRHEMGLDRPFFQQYFSWLGGVLHGDFGQSLWTQRSVTTEIRRAMPVTLELGIMSVVLSLLVGLPLGAISAIRQNSPADYSGRLFAIGGLSFPDFWLGTMAILYGSLWFKYLPPLGYVGFFEHPGANLQQFMLPAAIEGVRLSTVTMRMMRSTMLEVLRQDYIRTAWSKGLRERVVVSRHALKNAMIPVITIIGGQATILFGGTVIMEQLFNLPGMGRLTLNAILQRDYTMVQGNVVIFAGVIVLLNLIVDVSYGWFDPRIRYQ